MGQETLERLIESVEDSDGRELLYRLKLVTGTFTLEHVTAVAAVPHQIQRPRERLVRVIGSWVQQDSKDQYVLSPLLSATPGKNLLPDTERNCHLALAELVRHRPTASFAEFGSMVLHYAAAKEYGKALSMLAFGLDQLLTAPPEVWDGGLTDLWASSALPGTEPREFMALIRAMQVATRIPRDKSIDRLIHDMEALLGECEPGSWVHIGIAASLSVPLLCPAATGGQVHATWALCCCSGSDA